MPDVLPDPADSEFRDPDGARSVALASTRERARMATGGDRRASMRHGPNELLWVRTARLRSGHGVSLIDLSSGGARLDSPVALGPNSVLALEIVGTGLKTVVPFRVVRCEVEQLTANRLIYRGGCEFIRPLDLPDYAQPVVQAPPPGVVFDVDTALKNLLARVGVPGDLERLSAGHAVQALKALHLRAANLFSDPMGDRLNVLLNLVVPALEHGGGLAAVIDEIESQLRSVVPHARVRFAGGPDAAADPAMHTVVIGIPGLAAVGPIVCVDVPRARSLNAWQLRVLKATSRLIALLQRLEPGAVWLVIPDSQPAAPRQTYPAAVQRAGPETTEEQPATATDPIELSEREMEDASGPQKVVVRYNEGESLKGYTRDFHASRAHFTLWSSAIPSEGDSVIVPLQRLKAVFFVRDFAGNPSYVERQDLADPQHGRRIEVTLSDEEIIVGTTLNYRPDGQGFFVTPIDPQANNIRIFIVANSVRQIRFPLRVQRATA